MLCGAICSPSRRCSSRRPGSPVTSARRSCSWCRTSGAPSMTTDSWRGRALTAVLTASGNIRPASAHGHWLKRVDGKHAQSEGSHEASGRPQNHQRRAFRDKLAASASRSLRSAQSATSSDSEGLASVYSDQDTASGEKMNPGDMTAAHRTLPFGTKVTVVNRRNGRSAVVRINDRGPFVNGRVIDLSPAAADALDLGGLAPVSLIVDSMVGEEIRPQLAAQADE
jgi:rare lipoprotein A